MEWLQTLSHSHHTKIVIIPQLSKRTRTIFTGEKVNKVERIDWVEGDMLRIWCGQATMGGSNQHYCDYVFFVSV